MGARRPKNRGLTLKSVERIDLGMIYSHARRYSLAGVLRSGVLIC